MDFLREFRAPERRFSVAAFWFWNGELKSQRLLWQMDQMAEKGVYNAFMHARAYLVTPYLGEKWFSVVGDCVRHAKEIGFYPWLYDEYAWPSGTAGSTFECCDQAPSRVLAKGERNMAKGLDVWQKELVGPVRLDVAQACGREPLAVYIVRGESVERVSGTVLSLEAGDAARAMAFFLRVYEKAVDYLNPQTIRDFLDSTHEQYKARFGADFGTVIPGVFFDEIYMAAHPLPWTEALPAQFFAWRGYDLLDVLPLLMLGEGGAARKVRVDYYTTLARMYEEAFFQQISQWCAENHLQMTGHTEEELAGHPTRQGDYFATMRHLQIPGADCHDYRYRLPREITLHEPKYAVSVARAYGKPRAMSEAMGGAGWGCSLQEYKRGLITLGAMGIGMFVLHGFYNECEHQGSQADWPASFFYQNPYWKYFGQFSALANRISFINSTGRAVVDVGLYYPIREYEAHVVAGRGDAEGLALCRRFDEALNALLNRQMDTDMVDADSLARAEVRAGRLCVGTQALRALVFPAGAHLAEDLVEKLAVFQAQGGVVAFYACAPGEVPPRAFAACPLCAPEELPDALAERYAPDVRVRGSDLRRVYVSHRRLEEGDLYLIANGKDCACEAAVELRGAKLPVALLDPETGEAYAMAAQETETGLRLILPLLPDQCLCLLCGGPASEKEWPREPVKRQLWPGKWSFLPLEAAYDEKWDVNARESRLALPLATFSAEGNGRVEQIRIRNAPGEKGCCARHYSPWRARWIGRRIGWVDDAEAADLYFRKRFQVAARVQRARLCVAAVNDCEIYLNGALLASLQDCRAGVTLEFGAQLLEGENLLAVHVHCAHPLHSRNVCEADRLPPERIASLLLQAEVITTAGTVNLETGEDWIVTSASDESWRDPAADCEASARYVDAAECRGFALPGIQSSDWLFAWERGRPPMQPWGAIDLYGEAAALPEFAYYGVELPAGMVRVEKPVVQGEARFFLDGRPAQFAAGYEDVDLDGKPHRLQIAVRVRDGSDGLLDDVHGIVRPFYAPLFDWERHGWGHFSGRALYKRTLHLPHWEGRLWLDLGAVCQCAEVWVNGKLCGVRAWAPYRVEITDALREGANEVAVVVANSAACERRHMLVDEGVALGWNRYWNGDNMEREPQNLVSGLLGPVWLCMAE